MGVHLTDHHHVALFDSVTGAAFGPVFDSPTAREKAEHFLEWLEGQDERDPREIPLPLLHDYHTKWHLAFVSDGCLTDPAAA